MNPNPSANPNSKLDTKVIDTKAMDGIPTMKGTVVTITAAPVVIPRARQSVEVRPMPPARSARSSASTAGPAVAGTQVTMVEPLAGFETDTKFTLSPIDEAGMLQSLRSVRDAGLRFVVSPAEVFFGAYRDSLTDVIAAPVASALDVSEADADLELYVMLTIGTSLTDTTANLRAPLVIDHVSGKAVQVILDDDTLPLREPLPTE